MGLCVLKICLCIHPDPMPEPTYRSLFPVSLFYCTGEDVLEVALHEPAPMPERIPEAFVHDLWQAQLFPPGTLVASSGEPVEVLDPGERNTDTGPDFTGARVRIGEVSWAGDVEIHTTSSGWYDHLHHLDPRYNAVVLHVSLYADLWTGGLLRQDGSLMPELTLAPYLQAPLHRLLYQFRTRPAEALPCADGWPRVPLVVKTACVNTLAHERITERSRRLAEQYLHTPDLTPLLYERLFTALGYAKNGEAMGRLARRVPLSVALAVEDAMDLEALYLGVAGLLPTPAALEEADCTTVVYVRELQARFDRLQARLSMPVMAPGAWQFFRLRPANFPPRRIAQGAALVHRLFRSDALGTLAEAVWRPDAVDALRSIFQGAPSSFWNNHVRLDRSARTRHANLGQSRIDVLISDAVVPVLLLYAEQTESPALSARLFEVLQMLPGQQNEVTRRFENLGFRIASAYAAQGVHQLYGTRCRQGRCLSCPIGRAILQGV